MKKLIPLIVIALIVGSVAAARGGTTDGITLQDRDAITRTALDYIDGYYTGDGERMARALHPDLAKRIIRTDPNTGKSVVQNMTSEQLVQITRMGGGTRIPADQRQNDVTILDVFGNTACVKIVAGTWIDYLHVGRVDGEWKIINVLWEMKPRGE